jgi:hypothetical protein
MKKPGLFTLAAIIVFGCGFLDQNEDGNVSVDTAGLAKQTEEATKQAEVVTTASAEKVRKAAESINVSKEEIPADLGKSADEITQKVAGMDPAQLAAT